MARGLAGLDREEIRNQRVDRGAVAVARQVQYSLPGLKTAQFKEIPIPCDARPSFTPGFTPGLACNAAFSPEQLEPIDGSVRFVTETAARVRGLIIAYRYRLFGWRD